MLGTRTQGGRMEGSEIPLCYGGTPDTNLTNHFNSRWRSVSGQKPSKFGSCIWITVDRAVASDARGPGSSSVIASFCRTFIVKQLFRIDKNIANEASNVHLKLYFVFLPMTVLSLLQLIIPKGQVRGSIFMGYLDFCIIFMFLAFLILVYVKQGLQFPL